MPTTVPMVTMIRGSILPRKFSQIEAGIVVLRDATEVIVVGGAICSGGTPILHVGQVPI